MKYLFLAICIFTSLLIGCSAGRLCDCQTLNELGAMPDENGTVVNRWLCRQTENAQYTKGMIYQADWIGSTDRLGPFGRKRLGQWIKLTGPQPSLFVETSGDEFLDSQRQASLASYLNQIGVAVSPSSIQIANADRGLTGEEVPAVVDLFLSELNSSGDGGSQDGFSGGNQGGGLF